MVQNCAPLIIGKTDTIKAHGCLGDQKWFRMFIIFDFCIDAQELEHLFHVDQRLFDLAVNHAEKIQRNV